jgi:Tfp pilus assembly protein PilF
LRLRAVTLNNLGCYYKKKGRLRSALKCLGKALKIESRLKDVKNPADTHLNICACQSQLGCSTNRAQP